MLDVIKNRYLYLWWALIVILFCLYMIIFKETNLWIDMTWWTQNEYTFSWSINFEEIKTDVENLSKDFNSKNNEIINWISVYTVTWENRLVVETWFNKSSDEKSLINIKNDFNTQVLTLLWTKNNSFSLNKYQDIGQSFWDYIKKTAVLTLVISLIAISLYLAYAFYWVANWLNSTSFWLITLVTLFHDVVVAAWLYIFTWLFFPEFKIDTFFVTALLTILWYSINDTIVVFDRIRENIKVHVKKLKIDEIINLSINETLARSLFTSLTVFIVLVTIFVFWPETLKWFMLTLIYWVLFGTYSSIFVASPLLYEINKNKELQIYEKKEVKAEDKIVV